MTHWYYGKAVPFQFDMLDLGGDIKSIGSRSHIPADRERISARADARKMPCKKTGQDFGYDLGMARVLLNSNEHRDSYTHPYAWDHVERRLLELMEEPDRLRLVAMIESESGSVNAGTSIARLRARKNRFAQRMSEAV